MRRDAVAGPCEIMTVKGVVVLVQGAGRLRDVDAGRTHHCNRTSSPSSKWQ
jgi:hypothetical protein